MGKKFKIVLAILLTLVCLALVLFLTVGGLPAKLMADRKAELTDYVASDYPYADVPPLENGKTLEQFGLRMTVPADMHQKVRDNPDSSDSSDSSESVLDHVYVSETCNDTTVFGLTPFDFEEFDLDGESSYLAEKALNRFSESIGLPHSGGWDWYTLYNLLYHMDSNDCNIHSFGQANTYYALALFKDEAISPFRETWYWHPEGGDGFIVLMKEPTDENPDHKYTLLAELYTPDERNIAYQAMISSHDLETCCAIVNSITPAKD